MLALFVGSALAQSVIIDDAVLVANAVVPDGVGAPTVIHDASRGRLLMLFEARTTPPAGCTEGWRIGAVTSTDGRSWASPRRVLGPGVVAPCGPRAPAAVLQDDGRVVVIFTITEPGADAGVGIATWTPGVAPGSARIPALEGLREPSLARSDGVWQVIGVDDTLGLVRAQSPDLVAWTVDTAAVVPTGATLWAADAVSSPSLSCLDDPSYPWSLHYGGQSGSDTAWGWSVGDSWGTYFVGPETDAWSNGGGWLSFDVIESAVGSLAWFEHLGSDGLPRIGLASIGAPDLTTARDRDCSSAP